MIREIQKYQDVWNYQGKEHKEDNNSLQLHGILQRGSNIFQSRSPGHLFRLSAELAENAYSPKLDPRHNESELWR